MKISSITKDLAGFVLGALGAPTGDSERAPLWAALIISGIALILVSLVVVALVWK